MASSPTTKLEVAKEITLKALEKMQTNFGSDISAEEYNSQYAAEINKLFKSIYKAVYEADKGLN
ncbi:hypothetical protein P9E76_01730 [Schinkia azotoformans]|uniref:Uncharacterized protein n=1 Tax=Schinkia azotoformans LMG 9581 TaxID=1131731 RepID=K6C9M7_SCHAZ|nr:hypothetical protein [Schinkia azotoformans]EKN67840.1 hypothetical protein BAZO_08159 [Schinkia azotoformans LMG 9581]MEC1637394.1 hypothetical protein [Schinkia azotoformans]MEC1943798.1 hypothetical protein [Schinkia azotoformans]